MRVSVFLDVSPMYCAEQSVQENVYIALCCCKSGVLSLCLVKVVRSLLVGLWATSMLCFCNSLEVISDTLLM